MQSIARSSKGPRTLDHLRPFWNMCATLALFVSPILMPKWKLLMRASFHSSVPPVPKDAAISTQSTICSSCFCSIPYLAFLGSCAPPADPESSNPWHVLLAKELLSHSAPSVGTLCGHSAANSRRSPDGGPKKVGNMHLPLRFAFRFETGKPDHPLGASEAARQPHAPGSL